MVCLSVCVAEPGMEHYYCPGLLKHLCHLWVSVTGLHPAAILPPCGSSGTEGWGGGAAGLQGARDPELGHGSLSQSAGT